MTDTVKQTESRIQFLYELFENVNQVHYWNFDSETQLLETNCDDLIVNTIFENSGCRIDLKEYSKSKLDPLVLTTSPGLMWAAVFESDESNLVQTHVIGPVLNTDISRTAIDTYLDDSSIPISWKNELINTLHKLPVISTINFYPYIMMLHYTITGQIIMRSDIQYLRKDSITSSKEDPVVKDRHRTFMFEQNLLQMVKEGNLNYQKALSDASTVSTGVGIKLGDPLLEAKISGHSFITLCVRAAIEGGLSPEFAYSRGDAYTQSLMESSTLSEIASLNHMMYEDFIRCVHKKKMSPSASASIKNVCDYIDMNLENHIDLETIAQRVSYTEYYLSRKFKNEIGMTINEYIRQSRISRAKMLLSSTQESIQNISDRLHFCSRSYFSSVFKDMTGATPVQYRKEHQRI